MTEWQWFDVGAHRHELTVGPRFDGPLAEHQARAYFADSMADGSIQAAIDAGQLVLRRREVGEWTDVTHDREATG